MERITLGRGESPIETLIWQANTVDARGRLVKSTHGNQVESIYDYHPTGQLKLISANDADGQPLVDHSYLYDPEHGELSSREDKVFGLKETVGYDAWGRLNSLTVDDISAASQTYAYQYDELGNLQGRKDRSEYQAATFEYGPQKGDGSAGVHAIAQIGARVFSYDANGNLDTDGNKDVSWNAFNKPINIARKDATQSQVTFNYGIGNRRVQRLEPTRAITYWQGGSDAMIEREVGESSTTTRTYYQVNGQSVLLETQVERNDEEVVSNSRYLHHDRLGSVVASSDAVGKRKETYSFDVWGDRRAISSADPRFDEALLSLEMSKGFTGHEMLDIVGLVHMNGRIYDPALGRFLSADPIVQNTLNAQNYNRYSYIQNNPLGGVDPSGYTSYHHDAERRRAGRRQFQRRVLTFAVVVAGSAIAPGAPWQQLVVVGATQGAVVAGIWGAGTNDILKAAIRGGISAGVANKVGDFGKQLGAYKPVVHAATQAAISVAFGGSSGEISGTFLSALAGEIPTGGLGPEGQVVLSALVGGVASELGGGEFVDGALTGAFVRLYNHGVHPHEKPEHPGPGKWVLVKDPSHTDGPFWMYVPPDRVADVFLRAPSDVGPGVSESASGVFWIFW